MKNGKLTIGCLLWKYILCRVKKDRTFVVWSGHNI